MQEIINNKPKNMLFIITETPADMQYLFNIRSKLLKKLLTMT